MFRRPRLVGERSGLQYLAVATCMGFLSLIFAGVQAVRSRDIQRWDARVEAELLAQDVLESALEEATHETMLAVNDPAHSLFKALRSPAPGGSPSLPFVPRLVHLRRLLASERRVSFPTVVVAFEERRSTSEGQAGSIEWQGLLRCEARISALVPVPLVFAAARTRDVRVALVAAPHPLTGLCSMDVNLPLSEMRPRPAVPAIGLGENPTPVRFPLEHWRHKASLKIGVRPGRTTDQDYQFLCERLGALNGVVLVDNAGGRPLHLVNRAHRGRTLMVVTGALEMAAVRLEDPGKDSLTVLAFGDVKLAGELQGCLILAEAEEEQRRRPVARSSAPGTRVRGSLIVAAGPFVRGAGTEVDCLDPSASGERPGRLPDATFTLDPDLLFVSISPTLLSSRHWMES